MKFVLFSTWFKNSEVAEKSSSSEASQCVSGWKGVAKVKLPSMFQHRFYFCARKRVRIRQNKMEMEREEGWGSWAFLAHLSVVGTGLVMGLS